MQLTKERKQELKGEFGRGGSDSGSPEIQIALLTSRIAQMTELANDPKASMVEALGADKTREQQVPIIDGLVNNNEGQFQVNVPNRGALEGVPDNVVVEVPAIVNVKGIQPIHVGALPAFVLNLATSDVGHS